MSFGEFCDCLATFLLGKRDRQAHVLFKLIDEEGGGTLSKIELLQFFAGGEMDKDKKQVSRSRCRPAWNYLPKCVCLCVCVRF